jgi:hypothetical protein
MRRVETDGFGFSVGIFWDWNLKKSGFILYTPEEYGLLIEKRGFFSLFLEKKLAKSERYVNMIKMNKPSTFGV